MEAINSVRLLPYFDYIPTHEGKPSHRSERVPSPRCTEREREVSWSNRSGRPYTEQLGRRAAARPSGQPMQWPNQQLLRLPIQPIPDELPGSRNKSRSPSVRGRSQVGDGSVRDTVPTVTVHEVLRRRSAVRSRAERLVTCKNFEAQTAEEKSFCCRGGAPSGNPHQGVGNSRLANCSSLLHPVQRKNHQCSALRESQDAYGRPLRWDDRS
ncbi:hypothetical protein Cgig2_011989 [Carnegiea gigantea]|uniref:Uncharacterized protein n=1 Tax=Carnegiea gigantea TaxID=171969 RepID=A0A9Q1GKF6_9CARY|nr:hypothetical protein Cgig2_011989 [Carnegiea gigantea]